MDTEKIAEDFLEFASEQRLNILKNLAEKKTQHFKISRNSRCNKA